MEFIDNMGDAHEALEECFEIIRTLTRGDQGRINECCRLLGYVEIDVDLIGNRTGG